MEASLWKIARSVVWLILVLLTFVLIRSAGRIWVGLAQWLRRRFRYNGRNRVCNPLQRGLVRWRVRRECRSRCVQRLCRQWHLRWARHPGRGMEARLARRRSVVFESPWSWMT